MILNVLLEYARDERGCKGKPNSSMLKWPFLPHEDCDCSRTRRLLLKEALRERLSAAGHEVADFGAFSTSPADYPDYAFAVAERSLQARPSGVFWCAPPALGCRSLLTKSRHPRCARKRAEEGVQLTRAHNDANVIALGAKFLSTDEASASRGYLSNYQVRWRSAARAQIEKIAAFERKSR